MSRKSWLPFEILWKEQGRGLEVCGKMRSCGLLDTTWAVSVRSLLLFLTSSMEKFTRPRQLQMLPVGSEDGFPSVR